ncbi:peptidase M24 family protein [Bacillus canaveralius]|uniref:Peptidase M24 family protein n=1 Tax=Bacillus canaveralius TaxID=1403243 RepID=A0A2N5GFI7_9BACI|nr:Xaa-Pro peptidase family protein [Bacillus canaveralius]PLR79503.1 peptidase M24 family protein [Bacillus canaveralius]PLR95157.1 peptidase M24 family protein [Bacillus canaveralius]RSK55863.1 aminopeptidase P family protein [Bacillus canaveralius]
MNRRLQKLSEWMKENEVHVSLLSSPENVFYLSGFNCEPHERVLALAVFRDEEPFLVCPAMEIEDAKRSGWSGEIIGYSDIDRPWEMIKNAIGARGLAVGKAAVEKEHMNVERFEILSQLFPEVNFISAEEKMRVLRMIKDEKELSKIRKACELADFAIETGVQEIKEGKTELEIVAAVEYALKIKGVTEMSFATTVLTGANAASPHGTPGMAKVQKGDFVLFDLGVVVDGYCSDITRTVAFGEISEKQREIYETVLRAQLAAVAASKPGATAAEIDLTARTIIAEAGYGQFFPHRLGHGLGISVHEYPSLTETNPLLLEQGMVFTIEPGIYVPGVAGVRIEDNLVITADGAEILTTFPKELQIVK